MISDDWECPCAVCTGQDSSDAVGIGGSGMILDYARNYRGTEPGGWHVVGRYSAVALCGWRMVSPKRSPALAQEALRCARCHELHAERQAAEYAEDECLVWDEAFGGYLHRSDA